VHESQSLRGLARLVAELRAAQREATDAGDWHELKRRINRCHDLEARVDAAVAEALGREGGTNHERLG